MPIKTSSLETLMVLDSMRSLPRFSSISLCSAVFFAETTGISVILARLIFFSIIFLSS